MSSSSQNPSHPGYASQSDMNWTRSEKALARKAFDAALSRELHEVMQEAKRMASKSNQPADLWKLERYLTQRRKDIDRKYEFRSSPLTQVLGRLLYETRVREEALRGLSAGKLKSIRLCADFSRESAA